MKLRPEILIHPTIPRSLHGVNPRSIKGKDWWNAERYAAFEKQNNCCIACGVHKSEARYHRWLEGHEYYRFNYTDRTATYIETVGLCHCYVHSGLLKIKATKSKQRKVLEHGDKILIANGLDKIQYHSPNIRWKLLFEGKTYANPR